MTAALNPIVRPDAPLQRQRSSQLRKALQASIPKLPPHLSVTGNHDGEGWGVDTPSAGKKFPRDKEAFLKRQERALASAMKRNRLTPRQLGHMVGAHGDTVENWAKGETAMTGDAIEACEMAFLYLGDFWFFQELYGDLGVARLKRAQQIEAAARDVRRRQEMLSSPEPTIATEAARAGE
jgi:hypothetical protein